MDISKLSKDKAKVSSALIHKDQTIVAKVACKIMFPSRYFDVGLAVSDPDLFSLAIFAIIVEDKFYSLSFASSMMRLTPTNRYEVMLDEEAYTVLEFDKGSVVTPNRNLVQRDTMIYDIWELFISQGRLPWYLTEETLSTVFEAARKWTGVKLGANPAIVQMIIATVMRVKGNLSKQYRHELIDNPKAQAESVPLRSIIYGPSNTFSRLNGPYFAEGLPTALVNKSERTEPLEEMIRR